MASRSNCSCSGHMVIFMAVLFPLIIPRPALYRWALAPLWAGRELLSVIGPRDKGTAITEAISRNAIKALNAPEGFKFECYRAHDELLESRCGPMGRPAYHSPPSSTTPKLILRGWAWNAGAVRRGTRDTAGRCYAVP